MNRKNIAIIGSGNVGSHLAKGLANSEHTISGIWSRNVRNAEEISRAIGCAVIPSIESLNPSQIDLVILSVTDDAIETILNQLDQNIPVAYTSGSVRLNQLPERTSLGVFYPLQTFSKDREVDLNAVPFLIESSNKKFAQDLFRIAKGLSNHVIFADSNDRYQVHIAAVMVNNFTNHLYSLAKQQMDANALDFNLLKPLLRETVEKLDDLEPSEAQTGPAKRGDSAVIEKHLSSLSGRTKEIYKLLSDSILEKHK